MADNRSSCVKQPTLRKNKQLKVCKCGCTMDYSEIEGSYTCQACGYKELDLYGRMKEILTIYPNLSKMELSKLLQEPMKNINPYIEDGHLVNNDIY